MKQCITSTANTLHSSAVKPSPSINSWITTQKTPTLVASLSVSVGVCLIAFGSVDVLAQTSTSADNLQEETTSSQSSSTTLAPVIIRGVGEHLYGEGQLSNTARMGFLGDKDTLDTPFSTIRYTDQYISNVQAKDIGEVIAKTDPSVVMNRISGESNESYLIRGLPSNVGDVTVNGLAGMGGYYRNSPERFERVEVLKGPSALLNGMPPKGSAGGAVNLVPKRAGSEPLTRLIATYMTNSQFGAHLDVGRRVGGNQQLGVRLNAVYRDGETAVKIQDKKVSQFSLAIDWQHERARFSADLYQSEDHAQGLTRGLTLAPGLDLPKPPKPTLSWNPPWAFYKTKDKGAMLQGEVDLSEQLAVYASAGISKTTFSSNMGTAKILNEQGDFSINYAGVSDRAQRKAAELGLKGNLNTGSVNHQFAVNTTYFHEDYYLNGFRALLPQDWESNIYHPSWGTEPTLPNPVPAINRTKTQLTSVGIADTMTFLDETVQLTLGVRRQRVLNESFNGVTGARMGKRYDESATTPAAALLIKLNPQLSIYANYMEGLSQGAIAPNNAENAGEVFAPYKTKQKEIGLKWQPNNFIHTLSFYEIKRPSSFTSLDNVFSFGGEQKNQGVEWGGYGELLPEVRLMGGIAYTDAKVTKAASVTSQNKQAVGVPKWQAKLGVEWDGPWQGVTLNAHATGVTKQYLNADNSLVVPGHVILDMGARYQTTFQGKALVLRATVNNITNKAYWAKPHFTSLALGAPRTIMFSASMDF